LKARKRAEIKSKKQQAVSPPVEQPALDKDGNPIKKKWDSWAICNDPDKPTKIDGD
jgi:hypothetical protein